MGAGIGQKAAGMGEQQRAAGPEGAAGRHSPASFSGAEGGLSTASVWNVLNSFYCTVGNEPF